MKYRDAYYDYFNDLVIIIQLKENESNNKRHVYECIYEYSHIHVIYTT